MNSLKRILLVEDDKDDQEFFMAALNGIDSVTLYDVANNGWEALESLERCLVLPDFIFSDINMPQMNGIECLTAILKNPNTRNIPVVMFSTDIQKSELMRGLGAKAVIKKPIDVTILRRKLQKIIRHDFLNDTIMSRQSLQTELSAF